VCASPTSLHLPTSRSGVLKLCLVCRASKYHIALGLVGLLGAMRCTETCITEPHCRMAARLFSCRDLRANAHSTSSQLLAFPLRTAA